MARDPNRSAAQAHVLYEVFLIERRHKVEAVAMHVGVSPATFYGWIENKATLPAWAIRPIFEATRDLDLWARLSGAKDLGFRVDPPAAAATPASPTILAAALGAGAEVGDVQRKVEELGRDGSYDASDKEQLEREIEEAEQKLNTLRATLGLGQAGRA